MRIDKSKIKEIIDEELSVFEAIGNPNNIPSSDIAATSSVPPDLATGDDDDSAADTAATALTVSDPALGVSASRIANPNIASKISSTSKLGKVATGAGKALGPLAAIGGARSLASNLANTSISGVQKAALVGKDVADIGTGLAATPGAVPAASRVAGASGARAAGALAGPAASVAGAGLAGYEVGKLASKAIGSKLGPDSEYAKQAGKGVTDVDWKDAGASVMRGLTGKKRHTGGTLTGPPTARGAPRKLIPPVGSSARADRPVGVGGLAKVSEGTKSIDLIKKLVEQELREIDGGIMDPNMVPFVPHREPAADPPKESEEEDTEVDRLYRIAVKARLATEALVKALDDPIHDQAYDSAFKATMALRDTLNSLIDQGAKPIDSERLVAPHEEDQPRQDAPGYAIPFAGITYSGDNV